MLFLTISVIVSPSAKLSSSREGIHVEYRQQFSIRSTICAKFLHSPILLNKFSLLVVSFSNRRQRTTTSFFIPHSWSTALEFIVSTVYGCLRRAFVQRRRLKLIERFIRPQATFKILKNHRAKTFPR